MKFDLYSKNKETNTEWQLRVFDTIEEAQSISKSIEETHDVEIYQHIEINMFVFNSSTAEVRTVKEIKRNSVLLNPHIDDMFSKQGVKKWCKREREWSRKDIIVIEEINYVNSRQNKGTFVELSGNNNSVVIPVNKNSNSGDKENKENKKDSSKNQSQLFLERRNKKI